METSLPQHLSYLLTEHWVSAFFFMLTLTTIVTTAVVKWWVKRRLRRLMEEEMREDEHELDALPSPGPNDYRALELIKSMRSEVWELPEAELQLNLEVINQRAVKVMRAIAEVYHPEAEVPQYEASLVESLHMIRRVSTRLTRLATTIPFKYLANRRLSDYQRYYQVYRKINENPVLQVLKRNPLIYKAARWAMNIKNLANPIYWAGRELSREGYFFMLRWFYISVINQVGREAMRLYSGRHFQTEEDRDIALVSYSLFALTKHWGGPSPAEWSMLVDFVTGHAAMENEAKVHILSRCSQDKLPKDLKDQRLQTKAGGDWYRKGLKRLLDAERDSPELRTRTIRQEIELVEAMEFDRQNGAQKQADLAREIEELDEQNGEGAGKAE
ncbi:MAG: hypothetical protein ACLGPL_12360 [Acidobacteriota bacterium]